MLASISVFEPTLKRLILLVGEGRVEVLDGASGGEITLTWRG